MFFFFYTSTPAAAAACTSGPLDLFPFLFFSDGHVGLRAFRCGRWGGGGGGTDSHANHREKNGLCHSVNSFKNADAELIAHPLPRGAAPHLINIIIILIMLWVSPPHHHHHPHPCEPMVPIKREICWHFLEVRSERERERNRSGGGGLPRAAGGSLAAGEGATRQGSLWHADGIYLLINFFTTAVKLICIFYEAARIAAPLFRGVRLGPGALTFSPAVLFTVRSSAASRL